MARGQHGDGAGRPDGARCFPDGADAGGMARYFGSMFWFGMAAAGVMLLMLPVLRRWADPKPDLSGK